MTVILWWTYSIVAFLSWTVAMGGMVAAAPKDYSIDDLIRVAILLACGAVLWPLVAPVLFWSWVFKKAWKE